MELKVMQMEINAEELQYCRSAGEVTWDIIKGFFKKRTSNHDEEEEESAEVEDDE